MANKNVQLLDNDGNNLYPKIGDKSIDNSKIADGAVTRDKISDDTRLPAMIETTWSVLKDLRDNSKLIPGMQYRITDYQCTTVQEDTKSAYHQFDIIVTANSTSKLNEEARAIQHSDDTYFANSNLAAWKIWYCLDNDTNRFAWATKDISIEVEGTPGCVFTYPYEVTGIDNTSYYYAKHIGYTFMTTVEPDKLMVGSNIIWKQSSEEEPTSIQNVNYSRISKIWNTGIIFRMIDEFGNDCSYDFKNIMFNRNDHYYYTFSYTDGNSEKDLSLNAGDNAMCYGNVINPCFDAKDYLLPNNVFKNIAVDSGCRCNILGNGSDKNTFGNNCSWNTLGDDCTINTFGDECYENTLGHGCNVIVFKENCYHNTLGYQCSESTIRGGSSKNTIGSELENSAFEGSCNTFGDGCNNILSYDSTYYCIFDSGTTNVKISSNEDKDIFSHHFVGLSFGENEVKSVVCKINGSATVAKKSNGTIVEYNEADSH